MEMEFPVEKYMWIDTDPGIDDMYAIYVALCLYTEGIKVIGISSTYGNTNEAQCAKNIQQLLRAFKLCPKCRYIPKIYRGPSQPLDTKWKASVRRDEDIPIHGINGLADVENDELKEKFPQIWAQKEVEFEQESFIMGIEKALKLCKKEGKKLIYVSLGALTTMSLLTTLFREYYDSGLVEPIVMGCALPDSIVLPKNEVRLLARNSMLKFDPTLALGNMAIYGSVGAEHNVYRDVIAARNVLCRRHATETPIIYLVDWCQTIASPVTDEALNKIILEQRNEFVKYVYRISKGYPDFSYYTNSEKFFMIICDLVGLWFGLFHNHLNEKECTKRGFIEEFSISPVQNEGGITKLKEDPNGDIIMASYLPDEFLKEISDILITLFE